MKLSNRFNSPGAFLSEFDQFFDRAFGRPLFANREANLGVYEADDAWHLRTDLPGFTKEQIKLRFEDGLLTLTAEREENENHPFQSRVERSFRTPEHVNPEAISARLEHGVLEIVLPKVTPETPDRLEIKID